MQLACWPVSSKEGFTFTVLPVRTTAMRCQTTQVCQGFSYASKQKPPRSVLACRSLHQDAAWPDEFEDRQKRSEKKGNESDALFIFEAASAFADWDLRLSPRPHSYSVVPWSLFGANAHHAVLLDLGGFGLLLCLRLRAPNHLIGEKARLFLLWLHFNCSWLARSSKRKELV